MDAALRHAPGGPVVLSGFPDEVPLLADRPLALLTALHLPTP